MIIGILINKTYLKLSSLSVLLFIILINLSGYTYADKNSNFRFQHIIESLTDFKRPIGTITAMAQDRHGLMWFGGREVYRFEGRHIHVYLDQPNDDCAGLIRGLVLDPSGVLWVASTNGVCFFDESKDRFVLFTVDNITEVMHSTSSIKVDPAGDLYIGLNGRFAVIPNTRDSVSFTHLKGIDEAENATNDIQDFYFDKNNAVWLASRRSGLVRYDKTNGQFQYYKNDTQNPNILPSNNVFSIAGNNQGQLWFGMNNGGTSKLDLTHNELSHYYNGDKVPVENPLYTWHVLVDSEGLVWVSSDGGGLMRYEPELDRFISYTKDHFDQNSINTNKTVRTFEDANSDIWVSLFPYGLDYIDRSHSKINTYVHNPSKENSISNNSVLKVHKSQTGQVWVGTESGLNLFDPITGSFTNYSTPSKNRWHVGANPITLIKSFDRDKLWIGTWGAGLYLVDQSNNEVTHFKENPKDPYTIDTTQFWEALVEGDVTLFTTENVPGLLKYNHVSKQFSRITSWTSGVQFNKSHAFNLHRDSRGNLWIASTEGLFKVDAKGHASNLSSDAYKEDERIPSYRIRRIFEDADSNIWLGTENAGLFFYNPLDGKFRHIEKEQNLETLEVNCIDQTSDGLIWAFTNVGIIKVNPKNDEVQYVHRGHGLISDYFYRNGCFIDEQDQIYAGSANGLNVFDADQVKFTPADFPVHITNLRLFSKQNDLTQNLLYKDAVHLDYTQRMFTISYAGISYSLSHDNEYSYRLEGFEKNWNYVGTQDQAVYTNIPSGNYYFTVRARGSNGIWSEQTDSLIITIATPPWKSNWAYLLYTILFCATLALIWKIKRDRDERDKEIAINAEKIRLQQEKDEMRKNFIADVSHELKTPLAILSGEIEAIVDGVRPLSKAALASLDGEVKIINNLVKDLFEISLSDANALTFQFTSIDIIEVLASAIEAMTYKMDSKNLEVLTDFELDSILIQADRNRLFQLFINLLENAYRYTNANGTIQISSHTDESNCYLIVEDSEPGVANDDLDKLFQRFFRVETSRNRSSGGSGLGLSICETIVQAHGGTISAHHSNLGGLRINICFSLKNVGTQTHG